MNPKQAWAVSNNSVIYSPAAHRQTGSMLISVVFIILIMAILMAGMSILTRQSSQQVIYEVQSLKSRLVAESILEAQVFMTLEDINAEAIASKSAPEEIAGCEAYIELKDSNDTIPKQVNITATGQCATGQLTVLRNIEVEVIDED